MIATDIEQLLARAALLTFGIGATVGEPPHMQVMEGGSGVFIAPFLGITARHVSRALFALEPRGDPGFSTATHQAQHAPFLFQLLDPTSRSPRNALWHADRSWDFVHSDLCLMQVSAEDGAALAAQYSSPGKFFEISLLPPPVDALVQAFGYPRHSVRAVGAQLHIDAPATFSEGRVRTIHSPFRDRGMLNFPCFEVEMWADHGFSGGPVFHEGRLCGLVSAGSSFDSSVYVASLWPLLRTNVDPGLGKSEVIVELFRRGVLRSPHWPALANRVRLASDDCGEYVDLVHEPGVA